MTRPMPHFTDADKARFHSKVVSINTGCMEWCGARSAAGYGRFFGWFRERLAHRVAYFLATGHDPLDLFVIHSCDNPCCCAPNHLSAATHADNMADMDSKGRRSGGEAHSTALRARAVRGSAHGMAVLDEAKVRAIRAATGFHNAVAREFGVSTATISLIRSRKTWVHL